MTHHLSAEAGHLGNPRPRNKMSEAHMDALTPAPVLDAVLGYQQTAAMRAAMKLDLFTLVCAGTDTAETIAAACRAAPRGVRILADYLTIRGFLAKAGSRYQPTDVARAFLDRASPTFIGSIVDFMAAPEFMAMFQDDPLSYVRNGGSPGLANVAPDNPVWIKFAHAMAPFVRDKAEFVADQVRMWPRKPRRVLDVAAGHGLFGIAIANAVPDAAITAVDWQGVLEVARANAERAGMLHRYRLCPGSAFEVDWGTDFDLVLLPNFLHHFDHDGCVAVLRRVRASLAPEGRTLAVELVPDEDRLSPPFAGMFALMMLATTPKGDAHTRGEYEVMARDAGYSGVTVTPLLPTPNSVVEFI
jgi:2-polyprenyl-3-methyl-5-hydroxy-6-metoxy-1,4-benzoquinol methylase